MRFFKYFLHLEKCERPTLPRFCNENTIFGCVNQILLLISTPIMLLLRKHSSLNCYSFADKQIDWILSVIHTFINSSHPPSVLKSSTTSGLVLFGANGCLIIRSSKGQLFLVLVYYCYSNKQLFSPQYNFYSAQFTRSYRPVQSLRNQLLPYCRSGWL